MELVTKITLTVLNVDKSCKDTKANNTGLEIGPLFYYFGVIMLDPLGDRMKSYERVTSSVIVPRTPVILRLDGRSFHTFTKKT